MIQVLIVDDHPIVREGLRAVLAAEPDLDVVGECGTGDEAVRVALDRRPDVVLMDLRLPGLDGVAATERIVAAGAATVLVLTTYDTDGDIARAVAAGAAGYLLKECTRAELATAIRSAARGETVLAARRPTAPALTARELDVLNCVARGLSNPETGRELFIGEATVKSHVMRIFEKLGVNDRTAAVTVALSRGLIRSPYG